MSAGRIETYIHSDATTQNKGGAMVKVTCQTDFAARTAQFIAFSRQVAQRAYGVSATTWQHVVEFWPELAAAKQELEREMKEKIEVEAIALIRL
jgi:translation elongation factor EF-Ts